jgi:DNA-directed RNA polymerase subunit M/transcription elongation factor TFIIS
MLEFCPICKKLLQFGKWKGQEAGLCSCGFVRTAGLNIEFHESKLISQDFVGLGVVEGKIESSYEVLCEKCGSKTNNIQALSEILGNEKKRVIYTCPFCKETKRLTS